MLDSSAVFSWLWAGALGEDCTAQHFRECALAVNDTSRIGFNPVFCRVAMVPVLTAATIPGFLFIGGSTIADVVGFALLHTVANPLLIELAHPSYLGTILTMGQVGANAGRAVGPIICTVLYTTSPTLPWVVSATTVLLGGVLFGLVGYVAPVDAT